MTNVVTGKWVGARRDRWPIGRGVAICMRPEVARHHLEAGARLGDRMIAAGAAIRRVLRDLFAPLDFGKPANGRQAERTDLGRAEPREDEAA